MATKKQEFDRTTLLASPGGDHVTKTVVDFAKTALPELAPGYAAVLDNVFTAQECASLLSAAEKVGSWERAMVNVGGGRQQMMTDVRNCARIIWDDEDLVGRIWARCEPHVQEVMRLENMPHVTGEWSVQKKEVWKMTRLNERMRFLKYVGGEYFKRHCDGIYETPDRKERSYFTLHLYLNDETSTEIEPLLKGGATRFHSFRRSCYMDIQPKTGRVLIFQHRNLPHSGEDVVAGTKYTLRTDLMYTKLS
ncbi:uncharacterized protein PV09_00265 [Verruconis gallopava]|uniref:Prolyl 4-hydroxylase alpha subunit domain-containing protein n=1 Tax=Verruconis gallopava TaxID=253628 RepID=A0A0D1Z8N2_9PEZI|nr:uncharacterized protein PV09_00265 [Verruconis gallopava]KIW09367.1 hypothetical protein PV09_00265 [Verruconis gallopava]